MQRRLTTPLALAALAPAAAHADAPWSTPQEPSPVPDAAPDGFPEVAVGLGGGTSRGLVLDGGRPPDPVRVAPVTALGVVGASQELAPNGSSPQVAIGRDGAATVAWLAGRQSGGAAAEGVQAAERPAGATLFGATETVAGAQAASFPILVEDANEVPQLAWSARPGLQPDARVDSVPPVLHLAARTG